MMSKTQMKFHALLPWSLCISKPLIEGAAFASKEAALRGTSDSTTPQLRIKAQLLKVKTMEDGVVK